MLDWQKHKKLILPIIAVILLAATSAIFFLTGAETRTVVVYESSAVITDSSALSNEKNIYLTFDDGPGRYTETLLGYLRDYNVKATFFVTNQYPDYEYMLTKMADDGHAIGVHSLTHSWNIYSSVDSYLDDFYAMQKIIKERTGIETRIFRFPGGTSNTVSRKYATGIMSALVETMTEEGCIYFDWNVDSNDSTCTDSKDIAQNVISQIKKKNTAVVLMHDVKKSSVEAVRAVIEYVLANGYEFKTLDETSPKVCFKPAN